MSDGKIEAGEIGFLLYGAAMWGLSALISLCLISFLLSVTNVSSSVLGYVSSALSFAAAVAAGIEAAKKRGRAGLLTGLIIGVFLTALLLTIGYIITESSLSPDGIISVSAFTVSGCLLGGIMLPRKKSKKSRKRKWKR